MTRARKAAVLAAALFLLNSLIAGKLFFLEYSQRVETTEPSFLSISRRMVETRSALGWWPAWYGGIPLRNAYPPVLHAGVAALSTAGGFSLARAHHIVTALFFALAPCALFLLALRISQCLGTAVLAGLLYTLVSPSAGLVGWVRAYIGSAWRPWRLTTLVNHGDGPHIAALAMIPIALLALDAYLDRPNPRRGALCALALAIPPLTNWIGAFTLAISVFVLLLARTETLSDAKRWALALAPALTAYALASVFIPPSTTLLLGLNAQVLESDYRSTAAAMPLIFCAFAGGLTLLKFLLHRLQTKFAIQFPLLLAVAFAVIPLSKAWVNFAMVPQPHRYQLEMDLAICLLAATLVSLGYAKLPHTARIAAISTGVVLLAVQVRTNVSYAQALIQPVDLAATVENRVIQRVQASAPQGRVFAAGTISYWLNALTDLPQLGGGVDQALPSPAIADASFRLMSGAPDGDPTGEDTAAWLRAFGVDLAVVNEENAPPLYRIIRKPQRFAALGPELWRESGLIAYRVPRRSRSLAHVVPATALMPNGSGTPAEFVYRYASALEDPAFPTAEFRWTGQRTAIIQGNVQPDQVFSVQITFDPGWSAFAQGRPQHVERDGLGFIVIRPDCTRCEIELRMSTAPEQLLCGAASGFAALLIGVGLFWPTRDPKRLRVSVAE